MKTKKWVARATICLAVLAFTLFGHIEKQNKITALRIQLPEMVDRLKAIDEDNTRLRYEIERFESSENLIELARHQEFRHLRHPLEKEILSMPQGLAVHVEKEGEEISKKPTRTITLATGP